MTNPGETTPTIPGEPVLREARMHLLGPSSPGVGVVVSSERCTASRKAAGFVRHVAIDVSRTALAGNFVPGQSFGVIPPGVDGNGKAHKLRLYSIASPSRGEDGQGKVLATTVKRTIDEHRETHALFLGVCSNYLCDLRVGAEVKVTGPSGKRFVLPAAPEKHDYLFIATGTGIAPFRAMVMELMHGSGGSKVALLMGSPYATDLLYHDDFSRWAAERRDFRYLTAVSRERQADGGGPMYVHDRLAASRDELLPLLESERTLVYICGIAGMELGVFQRLATLLPPRSREQYLRVDAATLAGVEGWERRMIPRQLQPTRRVFLEVYD